MNDEATEPPVPVRAGANGATDADEEQKLYRKFGEANQDGVYGAAVVE